MKLATPRDHLEHVIKQHFADFFQASPRGIGRRYPEDLKNLIRKGREAGLRVVALHRLSGVSRNVIKSWLIESAPLKKQREKPPQKLRRLTVVPSVESLPEAQVLATPVTVRLPNGTTVEFASSEALSSHILSWLAAPSVKES